jgi:hypothetical protein
MYGAASMPASELPRIVHDIRAQLQHPDLPFGINLFVPPAALPPHTEAQQAALQQVHAYYVDAAARLGFKCKMDVPAPDLAALQGNFKDQVQVRGSMHRRIGCGSVQCGKHLWWLWCRRCDSASAGVESCVCAVQQAHVVVVEQPA